MNVVTVVNHKTKVSMDAEVCLQPETKASEQQSQSVNSASVRSHQPSISAVFVLNGTQMMPKVDEVLFFF